jgi:hypothetical protein
MQLPLESAVELAATIRMRKTRMKDKLLISSLAVLIALALGFHQPAESRTLHSHPLIGAAV